MGSEVSRIFASEVKEDTNSVSADPPSPPPSYVTGSPPPSFISSPPGSIISDSSKTIKGKTALSEKGSDKQKPPVQPGGKLKRKSQPLGIILEEVPQNAPTRPKRRRLIIWAFIIIIALLIVALIPVLVVMIKEHKHEPVAANATSTSTVTTTVEFTSVTSIISSTTLVLSASASPTTSSAAEPTPDYLGGFDNVYVDYVEALFYTDQNGGLQQIAYYDSWRRANPAVLANNVKPGSSVASWVTAIVDDDPEYYEDGYHTDVFFVNTENTINGIFSLMPLTFFETDCSNCGANQWYSSSINSLNLSIADPKSLRLCGPIDTKLYAYANDTASVYLYYITPDGDVQKYGLWVDLTADITLSESWQQVHDLPPVKSAGAIECQFTGGIETFWIVNSQGNIEQWWRSHIMDEETQWTKGLQGDDTVFNGTNILSIASSETNRTHIFYQDSSLNIRRYDIDGQGAAATISSYDSISYRATPGTRLSTYGKADYCGEIVPVYFQQSNTSDLHYFTFQDDCDTYSGDCSVTENDDSIMPLITTYGEKVEHHHHKHFAPGAIFGLVCAGFALLLLCCCCGVMAS